MDKNVEETGIDSVRTILFLHGFFASGECVPAIALRDAFAGKANVLLPDLPQHPLEALEMIKGIVESEKPDIIVGNSCGAFYAQMIAPLYGIPALLGNPHFKMTDFLKERIGEHEFKSPRKDGSQKFVIDNKLVEEFSELENVQFSNYNPSFKDRVWGLFGANDTLAHFEHLFLKYYIQSFHFPGGHTPTADEVRKWYVPLAENLMTIA